MSKQPAKTAAKTPAKASKAAPAAKASTTPPAAPAPAKPKPRATFAAASFGNLRAASGEGQGEALRILLADIDEELRELFKELRRIGNNVNQIARALNVAQQTGQYPPHQQRAVKEAAEMIRDEMRRVVAVMTGNFDYWGLPDADRPTAAPGAVERHDAVAAVAEVARKHRPRRRSASFVDGD